MLHREPNQHALINETYESKSKSELKIYINPFQVHSFYSGGPPEISRYTTVFITSKRQVLKTLLILLRRIILG